MFFSLPIFPKMQQILWEWKYKMWQKTRLLSLLVKITDLELLLHQCSLNLPLSLQCDMTLRYGDFLTEETPRESLWRRRDRQWCLVTSSEHSDREKKIKQWREGVWLCWNCAKMWTEERDRSTALGWNWKANNKFIILVPWSSHFLRPLKPPKS